MVFEVFNLNKLLIVTLLPVFLSILIYILDKKTKFKDIRYWKKQVIIGFSYGVIACIATELGIQIDGAIINVRNASPLACGLLFGAPAGILSGVIGGVYRFFATYWGAGEFSQIACTIGCVLAGLIGAFCRKYLFDNKKASWQSGLVIGATSETLHMLLVFITNMDDVHSAYKVVEACALPMIICNAISVMLSILVITIIGKEKLKVNHSGKQISHIFQLLLMICVVVAFFATLLFTFSLQTRIAYADCDGILKINLEDVKNDIQDYSNENLLRITRNIGKKITNDTSNEDLINLTKEYNVAGINIIDDKGFIIKSTNNSFIGYDMASGEQSKEFLCLLDGQTEYVQKYQPLSFDESISRKYAAITLNNGGFVQVGYDANQFQNALHDEILMSIKNRHIGKNGHIVVCDENKNVIKDESSDIEYIIDEESLKNIPSSEYIRFKIEINNTSTYCMFTKTEGFYLAAYIPVSEAMFSRNIAVTILAFMEVIVYAALFAHIYFLLKRLIVDNIHKINKSLGQITSGDLNVYVNVRENEEFASLSDDINATVDTLKRYISEAEKRIDQELEFARQIQKSSLPSVFPPFPERKEFDIYASMDPAKEVGGDFYDFFLVDAKHLVILVADVSGKGIPAALFMMRAKTLIKSLVESGVSIDEAFTKANKALYENNDAEMFVTCWLGKIDLETFVLEYVNAGHNPPLIKIDDEFTYLRTKPNFILAGMPMTKYKKYEIKLKDKSEIFLYTDGVTEATNSQNQLYGEAKLLEVLNQSSEDSYDLCEKVKESINDFVKDAEQSDDITCLCVKLNDDKNKKTIQLVPNNESIEKANDFVSSQLESWDISMKISNKVMLVLDEMYSNIVYYSKANNCQIELLNRENDIKITFEDDGIEYDPTKSLDPDITLEAKDRKIGGLGIFMVKKISESLEYSYINNKNTLKITINKGDK